MRWTDGFVDSSNRTTSIGGVATTCDVLGNRLTEGSNSYGWDCLSRLTSYNGTANTYGYRTDGMRISKVAGTTSTAYRYDGQMGFEDVDTTGSAVKVTDYGLGARGVDYIAATQSGTTTVGFPIYDTHGNMTACIFRYGTNYYSVGNQRHYDSWGIVRSGATTGDPKGRYCANLGHKADDETSFIYMRARYYDSNCGRFVSQDPGHHGLNWFAYCGDDPLNHVDVSGKMMWEEILCGISLYVIAYYGQEAWTELDAAISSGTVTGGLVADTAVWAILAVVVIVTLLISFAGDVLEFSNALRNIVAHSPNFAVMENAIDSLKTSGGPVLACMAESLEISLWLGAIDSGD